MHLTSIAFKGCPPPLVEGRLEFHERVNVFIGPNASGKSTLLRRIRDDYKPGLLTEPNYLSFSNDWLARGIPLQYIPATRLHLPLRPSSEAPSSKVKNSLFDTSSDIFHGEYVEAMLAEQAGLNKRDNSAGLRRSSMQLFTDRLAESLTVAYSCAREVCKEVVEGRTPRSYVEFRPEPLVRHGMGINTSDHPSDDPLYAGELSAGTQGTLLWVWALALRLWDYYYNSLDFFFEDPPPTKPAILLIDEIENHLHPTWQRRVIPALLNHFPGLQIFATTHSPFVVAGLRAGQVHMLKRDANGVVTATTNDRDIIGWTTDEILRTFMGVDEPTDQLTVDRTNRLRELRAKETLTEDEAKELTELRRQVNEDFISSSTPLEAQRERYGDMMLEFLRSRQSDLSQDNG